jgi:hypothetical protein
MEFICLGKGEVRCVGGAESYFDQLTAEASKIVKFSSAYSEPNPLGDVLCEFSGSFSGQLGHIKGAGYEIELLDQVPVRSPPYQYAPPKLKLLKEFVDEFVTERDC